ncbi:MAG: RNA-binding S4 domain-containing protein [Bacillota bacterium]|nr:RNA-binding S4 domain-containing protein [Bacillota bacterium]
MKEKITVAIETDYIKLDSLLKFAGLTATGSEAKEAVKNGLIKVNGATCLERGKKIRRGDSVLFDGVSVSVE